MLSFCTLFDSNYLDKGLLLYRSLEMVCDDFTLFVFCFDEKAKNVLERLQLKHAVLLRETDLETPELIDVKKQRTKGEYCWTCTPFSIKYVLDNFNVDNCTYIDSDLFFYKTPKILFDELQKDQHVIIVPHRLPDSVKGRKTEAKYGKYCVQFNYFDCSREGREVLDWWCNECIKWCYCKALPGKYGDQKYLDQFPVLFKCVHELKNLGAGVAPWNSAQYSLVSKRDNSIQLKEISSDKIFDVFFYHFQSIRFLSDNKVNVNSGTNDYDIIKAFYYPYLKEILFVREELRKYGIIFEKPISHSGSFIKRLYQKYVRPRIVRNKYDVIDLSHVLNGQG